MGDDEKDDKAVEAAAPEREGAPEPRKDAAVRPTDPAWINRIARIVTALAALSAGLTVWFAASPESALGKPLGARHLNLLTFAGAGVAGLSWWLLNSKLKSSKEWRSPGQGGWTRGCAYAGAAGLALFAAHTLHGAPPLNSWWDSVLAQKVVFGKVFALRPVLFPSALVFFGVMVAVHAYLNRERPTEFLVETQGEMRKVSWPARREWIGSTLVVIVVMTFLALFLAGTDWGLSRVLKWMGIGI